MIVLKAGVPKKGLHYSEKHRQPEPIPVIPPFGG